MIWMASEDVVSSLVFSVDWQPIPWNEVIHQRLEAIQEHNNVLQPSGRGCEKRTSEDLKGRLTFTF